MYFFLIYINLQLLDLSKWPTTTSPRPEEEDYASPAQTTTRDSPIISFEFPSPMSAKVSITEQDVGRLAQILNLTDMHKVYQPLVVSIKHQSVEY